MNCLGYALKQTIGIYYKDLEWASKIFNDIRNYYGTYYIEKCVKSHSDFFIALKDGSTIRFMKVNENCRGLCFSKIIVQSGIEQDIIKKIILPTLKHQNRNIMILKNDGTFDL